MQMKKHRLMSRRHSSRDPRNACIQRGIHGLRQSALAVPLATLEHGALGVWDEVAVGALLVGCAIAYAVWFYLTGHKEKPQDKE